MKAPFQIPSGKFRNPHDRLIYQFELHQTEKKGVVVKHKRYRENGDFVNEGLMPIEALEKSFSFGSFLPVDLNAPVDSLGSQGSI